MTLYLNKQTTAINMLLQLNDDSSSLNSQFKNLINIKIDRKLYQKQSIKDEFY